MPSLLFTRSLRGFSLRLAATAALLLLWFWTQSALGTRPPVSGVIGDKIHTFTAGLNAYLAASPRAANSLLIVSSALIDALALFLIGSWLFAARVRLFLGFALLMALRQVMQALCALPVPQGMIWHDPGFPSLLVTYSASSDFFFSGHTAIAVYGAAELARFRRRWLTGLAWLIVAFEVTTMLVLRAHYTMDVFAGATAALWIGGLLRQSEWQTPYKPQNDGSGFSSSKPTSQAS